MPTVLVGLYGWDTKDFIVGVHERLIDDNGDGKINSDDQRTLEFEVGAEHPRMKTVSAEGGKWEVTADLSTWADKIADGSVKRVEIGVLPALENADGVQLALDAASRRSTWAPVRSMTSSSSPSLTLRSARTATTRSP